MNTIVSIAILILALSAAFAVLGLVAYIFDFDDLVRQIRLRMEARTTKMKQTEYERGRAQGRKDFALQMDRVLDAMWFEPRLPYTYQVKEELEKRIAEEVRK